MPVAAEDVSVVVQGPETEWTMDVVRSVRRHLPGSQLVLSTYAGPDLRRFGADVLVENEDPGSVVVATRGPLTRLLNLNRMIATTRAGLEAGDRHYAFKLRSDSPLTSGRALRWLDVFGSGPSQRLFSQRILTMLGAGVRQVEFPYSLPDLVHLGLRSDLVDLWSPGLVDEGELVSYFSRRGVGPADPGAWNIRFASEQVIWLSFLARHGAAVDYEHNGAPLRPGQMAEALRGLVANVVMLDPWQMGVSLPKHGTLTGRRPLEHRMSFSEWLRLDRTFHPELHGVREARGGPLEAERDDR